MSTPTTTTKPSAYIIGAGPGIGLALAHLFASKGFSLGLIARSASTLTASTTSVLSSSPSTHIETLEADASAYDALPSSLDSLKKKMGDGGPSVVIYNVGSYFPDPKAELGPRPFAELDLGALKKHMALGVLAPIIVGRWAAVNMVEGEHKRALYFTNGDASFTHYPSFEALSISKAGERAVNKCYYGVLKPQGIHSSTIIVCGHVTPTDPKFNPTSIAAVYWKLYEQKEPETWEEEVVYNKEWKA